MMGKTMWAGIPLAAAAAAGGGRGQSEIHSLYLNQKIW